MQRPRAASTSAATCPGNACISRSVDRASAPTSSSTTPTWSARKSRCGGLSMAKTARKRKSAAPRKGKATMSTAVLREIALQFPDVEDASTERGVAFKARGRLLTCAAINESAEPNSLVIRIGAEQRARLMAAYPEALYLPEHYA